MNNTRNCSFMTEDFASEKLYLITPTTYVRMR